MSIQNNIFDEITDQKKRGVLLVLTGPTCAGKDALIEELLKKNTNLIRLVTTTSRPPRPEEKQGHDYYFVEREQFEELIAKEAFVEWVEYRGHYKGGQKQHVEQALSSGKDVVWRIDVRGVKNIKSTVKKMINDPNSPVNHVAFVFLTAPDLNTLEKRIIKRGTESEKEITISLNLAKWEFAQFEDSDYLVVNEDGKLDQAVVKAQSIIEASRLKISKNNFH